MVSRKAVSALLAAVNGDVMELIDIVACMQDLNPAPFRGDAKIPHVSEDFFKMFFVGANVRKDLCTPPPPPRRPSSTGPCATAVCLSHCAPARAVVDVLEHRACRWLWCSPACPAGSSVARFGRAGRSESGPWLS